MNARKNNDELRILQTRMQSLQSRKAEIDEELRELNRKAVEIQNNTLLIT